MNSFTLTAIGNLTRNPDLVAKGDTLYARFCLVGNDYAGKDDEGVSREAVTAVWFVAFGALGEKLVRDARKGDQLIVEARMRSNNWTDKQGEKQYDHSFIVQGYRFGAPGKLKREARQTRRDSDTQSSEETLNGNAAATGEDVDAGSTGGSGAMMDVADAVESEAGPHGGEPHVGQPYVDDSGRAKASAGGVSVANGPRTKAAAGRGGRKAVHSPS